MGKGKETHTMHEERTTLSELRKNAIDAILMLAAVTLGAMIVMALWSALT
jgi:hypothetical protein